MTSSAQDVHNAEWCRGLFCGVFEFHDHPRIFFFGHPASKNNIHAKPVRNFRQLFRFHVSVRQNMRFHTGFCVKMSTADGTGDHNVSRVDDFVHVKTAGLAEPLPAVRALVGLVLGVDVLVVAQMVLASEGFAAHITREGSFVGVGALVDHQVVGLGELTVTKLADEALLGAGAAGVQRV